MTTVLPWGRDTGDPPGSGGDADRGDSQVSQNGVSRGCSGSRGAKLKRGPWDCGQVRGSRGSGNEEPWELERGRDSGCCCVRGDTGEKWQQHAHTRN